MPDNIYGPTDVIKHILMPESTDGTKPEHGIQTNLRFETRSKSSFFFGLDLSLPETCFMNSL